MLDNAGVHSKMTRVGITSASSCRLYMFVG